MQAWASLDPPGTLQTLFGFGQDQEPFAALTHLTVDGDLVSGVRSATATLPQLSALTHLSCPVARHTSQSASCAETKGILEGAGEFGFWAALANTGVRLRSLKDATASREMLAYLGSYSALDLQELEVRCFSGRDDWDDWDAGVDGGEKQEMGAELWRVVVGVSHHLSLPRAGLRGCLAGPGGRA
ncbi:hypothetical protein FA15DRAFT_342739 [Coprinopsis marcescibilis]|uniref:Uncharacterized protein n=1 Tax=Coprinopsis marcescibilis TaxID=230819 RepID=A0A5C3KBG4_COPMA|nr:hypothetical protein FA15DRAFT_342739 [Coprinopsis marcescibilis]